MSKRRLGSTAASLVSKAGKGMFNNRLRRGIHDFAKRSESEQREDNRHNKVISEPHSLMDRFFPTQRKREYNESVDYAEKQGRTVFADQTRITHYDDTRPTYWGSITDCTTRRNEIKMRSGKKFIQESHVSPFGYMEKYNDPSIRSGVRDNSSIIQEWTRDINQLEKDGDEVESVTRLEELYSSTESMDRFDNLENDFWPKRGIYVDKRQSVNGEKAKRNRFASSSTYRRKRL